MLKPQKTISFGLLTRGRLSLTFPGWRVENTANIDETDGAAEKGQSESEQQNVSTNRLSLFQLLSISNISATCFLIRTPKLWQSLDVLIFPANFSLRCSYQRSPILRSIIKLKNLNLNRLNQYYLEKNWNLYQNFVHTFPVLWKRETKKIKMSHFNCQVFLLSGWTCS